MSDKILILGGTKEAAELAEMLQANGDDVTTSLAGRTREPQPVAGKIRSGGFGGAEKMAQWVVQNKFTRLIDATHPFAEQISKNAQEAARVADIAFEVRRRAPWLKQENDDWTTVPSLTDAAECIPPNARVFLALGSQHLSAFYRRDDVHFFVRMIEQPTHSLPFASHKVILSKPASDWQEEANLLRDNNITHIICRNSGGTGAYAKIEAARALNMPVIMIERTS